MAIGLHASSIEFIASIIRDGRLRRSMGQHHWLGAGNYFYDVFAEPSSHYGIGAALKNAGKFAERKFGKPIGYVVASIDTYHSIDLQHPSVREPLAAFNNALQHRVQLLGLYVEENGDWAHPSSHFSIDVLVVIIGFLTGNPIQVVRSQFNNSDALPVDELLSPELCVKDPRAIKKLLEFTGTENELLKKSIQTNWTPRNSVLKAIGQATAFLNTLSDTQFVDLVCKVSEGASLWPPIKRFARGPRISIVASLTNRHASKIEAKLRSTGVNVRVNRELYGWKNLCGPEEACKIDRLLDASDGIIAFADASGTRASFLLSRTVEKLVPMMIFATKDADIPCTVRSASNVTIMHIPQKHEARDRLTSAALGFAQDNWTAGSHETAIRQMDAARNCDRSSKTARATYSLDIGHILRDNESSAVELPGIAHENPGILDSLSEDVELAAQQLRKRIDALPSVASDPGTFAITRSQMLQALEPVKVTTSDISASGYFMPRGHLKQHSNVVVLKAGNPTVRHRFTVAHEIGHAVLGAAKFPMPPDEEDWCDKFASAFLMPRDLVQKFASECTSLWQWLDFAKKFEVSIPAATRRAWECEQKLLVGSNGSPLIDSPKPAEAREVMERGKSLSPSFPEERGTLSGGQPYALRKSRAGIEAVIDFKGRCVES